MEVRDIVNNYLNDSLQDNEDYENQNAYATEQSSVAVEAVEVEIED